MLDNAYEPSTLLPYLQILANLIAAIAWPIAAFAIAFVFRRQLGELIQKIESILLPGASIGMRKEQGNNSEVVPLKPTLEKLQPNVLRTAPVENIERSLRSDLNDIGV